MTIHVHFGVLMISVRRFCLTPAAGISVSSFAGHLDASGTLIVRGPAAASAAAAPFGHLPRAATHVCPMHSAVRTSSPGTCPRCGMAIVPIKPSSGRDYRLDFPTRSPRGGCLVMPSMARLVPDDELKKTVGTTSVQLTLPHGGVAAGREERFAYQVTDAQTSQPLRDIEPYLGPGGTHSS